MSVENCLNNLQNWLDGKYVSPPDFKESLKQVIVYITLYDSAVEEDDKTKTRYVEEIERLEKGIDRAIYNLANEDISDTYVVDQIRMDLVRLLGDEQEKDINLPELEF
jgi:hypothetical protein